MIICFDLDGTLVNSKKWVMDAIIYAFKKNNLKVIKKDMKRYWGLTLKNMIKKMYPNVRKSVIDKIDEDYDKERNRTIFKLKPYKNTKKVLRGLSKRYSLALVSNNNHKIINRILKSTDIDRKLFGVIIGQDDVKKPKPFPNEIRKAERKLKKKAIFMVGDSTQDIVSARKARIKSIILNNDIISKKSLNRADFVIKDIKEVKKILSKFS